MSQYLNPYDAPVEKLVNGVKISNNFVPIAQQDPKGILTLSFNNSDQALGTIKVDFTLEVEDLTLLDLSQSVIDFNRDSCIFPQKFTEEF